MPTVSILIPCYNCARWVHRAIETALAQTWPDKEVIVLDDGSTDASPDIIRRYASQIRIERQKNGGQNISRNHLTELSRGEWLVYLDADDELALDSIEKKLALASQADAIYGDLEVACFVGVTKTRFSIIEACEFDDPFLAALHWRFPNTSGFVFRREAVVKVGGWNNAIHNCTDYDLYFRLLLNGARFQPVRGSLVLYRHWSPEQAVYVDRLRRARTRLELLWRTARELSDRGMLDSRRQAAVRAMVFADVRTIGQFDLAEACERHAQLREWDTQFGPTGSSRSYLLAYRAFGFGGAERIANLTRSLRPRSKPEGARDPRSGLIYT